MGAVKKDLKVEQGANFQLVVDVSKSSAPAAIGGFTAKMQIREYRAAAEVLAEYTTENGSVTVNGTTSQVVIDVPAALTTEYAWTHGEYDLTLTGAGKTYRLMEGRVIVSPSVTR